MARKRMLKMTHLTDTTRSFIMRTGRRQKRRKAGIDYKDIATKTNNKYFTNLSCYQVAAYLGNYGVHN